MKNKIVLIIVIIIVFLFPISYQPITIRENKSLVTISVSSSPYVTAQPIPYQVPFDTVPFSALLDFNNDESSFHHIVKEFKEIVTTAEFENIMGHMVNRDFTSPVYNFSNGQLPPVVYNPTFQQQQSPR